MTISRSKTVKEILKKILGDEVGLWGFMGRGCLKKLAKHILKENVERSTCVVRIQVKKITEAIRMN